VNTWTPAYACACEDVLFTKQFLEHTKSLKKVLGSQKDRRHALKRAV
jgi:hypothetical protein